MINAKKLGLVGRCFLAGVSLFGLLKTAGCNESYMAGAAARGYGLRSGTTEGAASGAILGDYFMSEGDAEYGLKQAEAGRSQVIIVNQPQQEVRVPEGFTEWILAEDAKRMQNKKYTEADMPSHQGAMVPEGFTKRLLEEDAKRMQNKK